MVGYYRYVVPHQEPKSFWCRGVPAGVPPNPSSRGDCWRNLPLFFKKRKRAPGTNPAPALGATTHEVGQLSGLLGLLGCCGHLAGEELGVGNIRKWGC